MDHSCCNFQITQKSQETNDWFQVSTSSMKFLASGDRTSPDRRNDVDVTEEYANAFRTESYHQFWTRVTALAMSHKKSPPCTPVESTASARLLSYRLFVQNLLDPDQDAVNRILALNRTGPKTRLLLTEYFSETANASLLCSLLLKEINHTRSRHDSLKTITKSLESVQPGSEPTFPSLVNRLTELWGSINPLVLSATSAIRAQVIKTSCSDLLKRLESSRDKARAKLRLLNRLKHGCGLTVVAVTASLITIVASHALALLVAAGGVPSLTVAWWGRGSVKKAVAQLDVATKGMYIVSRDLDTISRLVVRLNDELEHVRAMAKLWTERGEGWVRAGGEVTRQLKRSDESFGEQLDELEEHLYLCFMTINRARNLVVKQILDPGKSDCPFVPISK